MRNRRMDERNRVRFPIKVVVGEAEAMDAELVDHSATGIGLILATPVLLGATVRAIIGADTYQGSVRFCKLLEGKRGYLVGLALP